MPESGIDWLRAVRGLVLRVLDDFLGQFIHCGNCPGVLRSSGFLYLKDPFIAPSVGWFRFYGFVMRIEALPSPEPCSRYS